MSYCHNINSDGRFINEIFINRPEGVALVSFPPHNKEKTPLDLIFESIKRYEDTCLDLANSLKTYREIIEKVKNIDHNSFWNVYSRSQQVGTACFRCGKYHYAAYSSDVATFNQSLFAQAKELQITARKAKRAIPPIYFCRDVARSRCKQLIQSFLENILRDHDTDTHCASLNKSRSSETVEKNKQIRKLFEYLLNRRQSTRPFAQGAEPLRMYSEDVMGWLLYAGSMLMRCASYDDHLFLLEKLLHTDPPSRLNGASLIQFPKNSNEWDSNLVDHFLQMLHSAVEFGTISDSMFTDNSIIESFSSVENFEKFDENNGGKANLSISDRDISQILCQFTIIPFINFILDQSTSVIKKISDDTSPEFASARSMFLRLFMLIRIACKASMNLRHTKSVDVLLKYATITLNKLSDIYLNNKPIFLRICSIEMLERTVLCMAYAIVHTVTPDMWNFLGILPLYILSERSSWEVFSILHMLPAVELKHSSEEWTSLVRPMPVANSEGDNKSLHELETHCNDDTDEWVIVEENEAEDKKTERVDNNNILVSNIVKAAKSVDNIQNVVTTFWKLVENCNGALTQACTNSLFRVVFSSGVTDKQITDSVTDFIGAICSKNINLVNVIVDILPVGFDAGKIEYPLYFQLIDHIPFGDWVPEPEYARTVACWTRDTVGSPRHETGRHIMDAVQWPKIPVGTNRAAAYALSRAIKHQYYANKDSPKLRSKEGKEEFKKYRTWNANTLGTLLYYVVGTPVVAPQGGRGVAEDISTVEYTSKTLLDELRAADFKGSIGDILKKTIPEELFALFMLAPFGTNPETWTRENSLALKLLKGLIDIPNVDDLKTPVLCQLVPYVFANTEDKETLKESIIPEYSNIVIKYMKTKANITTSQKTRSEKFDLICYQLISKQIDIYPQDIARSFGDFWLKIAVYQKKWLSDTSSLNIISVFLQSWFALKGGELPFPAYETAIASQISSYVNQKNVSMIPLKARGMMSDSSLIQYPYMLFETLYYETKYLFEHNLLNGEALAKKALQWTLYAIELPETCDIGVLFWQVIMYLLSRAFEDKECSLSSLKQLLKEKFRIQIIAYLEKLIAASKSKDISDFYAAIREYLWGIKQLAQAPGQLKTKDGKETRNWMLVTAIYTSPFEYPKCLMLPYVSCTEIANKIRSSLTYKEINVKKYHIKHIRPSFVDVVEKCSVSTPKVLINYSPEKREGVWDDNSENRNTIIVARDSGTASIYKELGLVQQNETSIDKTIGANDANYENYVRRYLYTEVKKNGITQVSCSCGSFFDITYEYITWMKNYDIENQIITNHADTIQRYNTINKLCMDVVNKVVFLDDTVHKLTQIYDVIISQADIINNENDNDNKSDGVVPQQISKYTWKLYDEVVNGIGGINIKTFLLTNMFKHIAYELTRSVVRANYDGALGVLNRIFANQNSGLKIAPFYTPWIVRRGFVELFRRMRIAYTSRNGLHEYVLKNFNVYEWARIGRPFNEKKAMLTEITMAFPRCKNDNFLCNYIVNSFEGIIRESFPALMLPTLNLLVPHKDCPAPRLWGALLNQDISLVNAELAKNILNYISSNTSILRSNRNFHYKMWGATFPEFVNAIAVQQVRSAVTANDDELPKLFYGEALKVFTPFLDAVSENSPWETGTLAEATQLISMFTSSLVIMTYNLMETAPKFSEHYVSELWRYVTETLKTLGPGNLSQGVPRPYVQEIMLNSLAGIKWGVWLPPRNVFKDIIAMACEHIETHTKIPGFSRFMVSFGTAISWSKTDYYSPDTLLELHCALTRALALYPDPVDEVVYDQVYRLNTGSSDRVGWDLLSIDMVRQVMNESVNLFVRAPRHKDELFKWFVLYVYMGQTCGIKIANISVDFEEDFCKDDQYYADVLTSDTFEAFVDYFISLQQHNEFACPGLLPGPVDAILCAYKGFFDGSAGTLESVEPAMRRILDLYNSESKNTNIHSSVTNFLRRYPECACLFSQHLCRCVSKSSHLLQILEDILGCYFAKFDDWGKISRHVSIPTTETTQTFIDKAIIKGYYLPFFVIFSAACNSEMEILKLDLYKLINYVTITPGKEWEFFLFCYALIKQTCIRLSMQPTTEVLVREREKLETLENYLNKISQDKLDRKNTELDAVFRVCTKTLASFIRAQFVDYGSKKSKTVRIVEKDPFSLKENLSLYKDVPFKKYIKRLGDSYIARVSEFFYDIMSNPEFTIFSYSRLLASIAECVYQGKIPELSCFHNDIEVEINVKSATQAITKEMHDIWRLDNDFILRNDCAHLGNIYSLGFNKHTVFEFGGTDIVISLICNPDFQKNKENIQVALTALWELVLVDLDIQEYVISKNVIPIILQIAKSTSTTAEAAYRLLSALLVDDDIYKKNITDEIIAKAEKVKSTKVFVDALARTENEEVVDLRTKETCSGARALRCTEKKCLDKKVFFCPHCNVQQHFYVCITCSKAESHTVQFCEVCWAMCHKNSGNHDFRRIFGVGKCSCKNYACKASAITSATEFKHMDPALVAQWVSSVCQFDDTTAEIFRQKNVSGKKLLSMPKSDMASIGLNVDQIAILCWMLSPYKSFFNRAASLFTRDYSYIDTLYDGECKFSFPDLYSHPNTLSEALTVARDILPSAVQVDAIYTQCLNILIALKNDPERMVFVKEFSLTDDEIMAILMYTYDISAEEAENAASNNNGNAECFSIQFNRLLREYTPTMQNSLSGYMYFTINALKKIPPYTRVERGIDGEEGVYVYRGIPDFSATPRFEETYVQGREVTWPSFSSVSANIEESRKMACSGEDPSLRLLFIVRVKKSARDIHCISAFSSESEVLIAPGTTFRVISPMEWSEPDSVNRIELEEVSTKFF